MTIEAYLSILGIASIVILIMICLTLLSIKLDDKDLE
jgi:hypothetical protein